MGKAQWLLGVTLAGALAALPAGCGQGGSEGRGGSVRARASVGADTGRYERWPGAAPPPPTPGAGAAPPRAAVAPPASAPAGGEVAQPVPAAPDTWPAGPGLPPSPGFKPPLLKTRPRLPVFARAGSVELDVLVDARGEVVRVERVGGSADSAQVQAAVALARAMTFYPALIGGKPVAAWSRQVVRLGPVRP